VVEQRSGSKKLLLTCQIWSEIGPLPPRLYLRFSDTHFPQVRPGEIWTPKCVIQTLSTSMARFLKTSLPVEKTTESEILQKM